MSLRDDALQMHKENQGKLEIKPDDAKSSAKVVGTRRPYFSNQVNKILAFLGIFKDILDIETTPFD